MVYVTKTENKAVGVCLSMSQSQRGLISTYASPVSTAGHESEGGESQIEKLVENSVCSLASCCLSECAIMAESRALTI